MTRSRFIVTFLVVSACVPLLDAAAQQLAPGDRVRITIRERQAQDEAPATRRLILRGDLVRLEGDTLFLRPAGTVGELGVARSAAVTIHRSRGVRSRAESAVRSGVGFAILGALFAGVNYQEPHRTYGVAHRGDAFALGAGIGAAFGIVYGAILPTERWQRIRRARP
ncbi:MAG TPA: hypothetical protein VFT29_05030 [Gemmatimonadaceae bacterium]|nr:hypothetical protein [Gemmatimonadaceae bacterium]